jgi:hypothetical protein
MQLFYVQSMDQDTDNISSYCPVSGIICRVSDIIRLYEIQ